MPVTKGRKTKRKLQAMDDNTLIGDHGSKAPKGYKRAGKLTRGHATNPVFGRAKKAPKNKNRTIRAKKSGGTKFIGA